MCKRYAVFLYKKVPKKYFYDAFVEKNYIYDLAFCFQRAIAYLFPSGLFDKRARPMMKVGFFLLHF